MITTVISSARMAKTSQHPAAPIPNDEVWRQLLVTDPEFRLLHEQARLADEVAVAVFTYRHDHGLSQRALADMLSMRQPQVARIESGEVNPTMETLTRLSKVLGLRIRIDISPDDPSPELAPIDAAYTTVTITQPRRRRKARSGP